MLVSGCAKEPLIVRAPIEVPITVYETVPVPEALLRACKVTLGAFKSNQDLELALAEALIELRRCTQDKEAIRGLE
jgi:hypothetical protein